MQRTKWTDRTFVFDFPEGWLLDILERLRGTGLRIAEMVSSLSEEEAGFKPGPDKWSMKEHIGHLSDLEELHDGRIDDFISGKEMLRPADMSNAKTNQANHSEKKVEQLIRDFNSKRNKFISRLEKLDDKTQFFKSMHPRLKTLMRPVDVAFFAAEHDDHHLASIREMLKQISINE